MQQQVVVAFLCGVMLLATLTHTHPTTNNKIQPRIISGRPAAAGQFPWQVILKKDAIDDLLCGASIISDTWVLTAAHCTYGLSSIFLMFGSVMLDSDDAVTMTSTELFVHPDYNNQYLTNDVSLIQLPQSLQFSDSIQAIPLVSSAQKSNSFVGIQCTIAGFGLVDDEELDYSENLLFAQVVIIDNAQCASIYGTDVVTQSTMCATGADGSNMSICSGDSGGPLITRDLSGNYVQIGINSFVAQDQCTEGFPSGYVRLAMYINYIKGVTKMDLS